MSAVDLLSRVSGSGSMHMKGQDFWAKDIIAEEINIKPYAIKSDAHGTLSRRKGGRLISLTCTLVGVWTPPQIAVTYPAYYLNPRLGDFNTPVREITAVDTGTSAITSPNHGQITGTGVRFGKQVGVTLPAGITVNTTYFMWCNADGDTILLFDTEAHALASNGDDELTGLIALTSEGTVADGAKMNFICNSPLDLTTEDGVKLTIYNYAVVDMAPLSLGALNSQMKQIKIEGYTLHGLKWGDANSLYSVTEGELGAVPPDQSQIPTVQFTADWATRLGIGTVDATANTLEIENHGLLTGMGVTVETLSDGATLPGGVTAGTILYVVVVNKDTIKFSDTNPHAIAGTNILDITSTGTGTLELVSALQIEGMQPRETIEITIGVTWSDVLSQGDLVCRRIGEIMSKVEFLPTNVPLAILRSSLQIQGGTAALGQALQSANLDVYGPDENPFIRIYGATLENVPSRYGTQADRVDKITFGSQRTFRGNAPTAFAFVGIAAPTN